MPYGLPVFYRRIILLLCLSVFTGICRAQTEQAPEPQENKKPRPENVKLIHEESDGKGNLVRIIRYNQGNMRVTETITIPIKRPVNNHIKIDPDTLIRDSVYLVINKTNYTLQVRYRKRVIRAYKAVFGPTPTQNKCMEGDRCTPEGWFRISGLNPRSKYHKFLRINYPNDSSQRRFQQLKKEGVVPATARIGGDIGIHGIWKGGDDLIELGIGWTDGCVALKNRDMEELYSMVGIGTRVYIGK